MWEVSDKDFKIMCDMTEEDFQEVCPDGMWRSSEGSIMGTPSVKWNIHGKEIYAWDGIRREKYYHDECKTCPDRCNGLCKATEDEIVECYGKREYDTLLHYLCNEIRISQPRNVCALVVDLAKANNMKMSELFKLYEG